MIGAKIRLSQGESTLLRQELDLVWPTYGFSSDFRDVYVFYCFKKFDQVKKSKFGEALPQAWTSQMSPICARSLFESPRIDPPRKGNFRVWKLWHSTPHLLDGPIKVQIAYKFNLGLLTICGMAGCTHVSKSMRITQFGALKVLCLTTNAIWRPKNLFANFSTFDLAGAKNRFSQGKFNTTTIRSEPCLAHLWSF